MGESVGPNPLQVTLSLSDNPQLPFVLTHSFASVAPPPPLRQFANGNGQFISPSKLGAVRVHRSPLHSSGGVLSYLKAHSCPQLPSCQNLLCAHQVRLLAMGSTPSATALGSSYPLVVTRILYCQLAHLPIFNIGRSSKRLSLRSSDSKVPIIKESANNWMPVTAADRGPADMQGTGRGPLEGTVQVSSRLGQS